MPTLYTIQDLIQAWDEAYGEDLREEEGFLSILERKYGKPMPYFRSIKGYTGARSQRRTTTSKPKRKLSAWNKYVKANSKKPRFRYRNGKLNLKKMAVAFRKTPAGKKKRR